MFHRPLPGEHAPVFIAPLRSGAAASESEWIQVTDGIEATPWSSPEGGILYFLSKRDGNQCIAVWMMKMN
jgi:hypothetical protein